MGGPQSPDGGPRTVVHLLRHGEVHNPEGVVYGRLPGFPLSEEGALMAKKAARALAGRDVAAVYSSPMERARQTAQPVADALDVPVAVDERLTEAAIHFEGHRFRVGGGALRHPGHWIHLRNPLRPSWGEPYGQVAARMLGAVESARRAIPGREVVCVSHQLPIWVLRRAIEGRALPHLPNRRQCALASITTFDYAGDQVVSVTYSEPAGHATGTAGA